MTLIWVHQLVSGLAFANWPRCVIAPSALSSLRRMSDAIARNAVQVRRRRYFENSQEEKKRRKKELNQRRSK